MAAPLPPAPAPTPGPPPVPSSPATVTMLPPSPVVHPACLGSLSLHVVRRHLYLHPEIKLLGKLLSNFNFPSYTYFPCLPTCRAQSCCHLALPQHPWHPCTQYVNPGSSPSPGNVHQDEAKARGLPGDPDTEHLEWGSVRHSRHGPVCHARSSSPCYQVFTISYRGSRDKDCGVEAWLAA